MFEERIIHRVRINCTCSSVLTAINSTGMGTGSFFCKYALSSLARMRPTIVTILTTSAPMLVCGMR